MKCTTCGTNNPTGEISCGRCGRMLPLEKTAAGCDPLIGVSYEAQPDDNFMGMYAARGRRFLLIFCMMFVLLLGLAALPMLMTPVGAGKAMSDPELLGFSTLGVGLVGLIFMAYLFGKTGESVGAPFAVNFLLALLPPLWPAVLARIAGRPMYLPYLYLAITLAAYGGVAWLLRDYAYLTGTLFILILPLLIYQLLGCSVAQVGPALGYGPVATFVWMCFMPVVLFVILLNSQGFEWLEIASIVDMNNLAGSGRTLLPYLSKSTLLSFSSVSVTILMFGLMTHLLWIRSVYQNLCYPQLE